MDVFPIHNKKITLCDRQGREVETQQLHTMQKSFINIAIKENIKDLRNMWKKMKITIPLNHSNHTIPTVIADNN